MLKPNAIIAENTRFPDTEDTQRMGRLIGKPLTRIEMFPGGKVVFEFDPYGAITIEPQFGFNITAALDPATNEPAKTHCGTLVRN